MSSNDGRGTGAAKASSWTKREARLIARVDASDEVGCHLDVLEGLGPDVAFEALDNTGEQALFHRSLPALAETGVEPDCLLPRFIFRRRTGSLSQLLDFGGEMVDPLPKVHGAERWSRPRSGVNPRTWVRSGGQVRRRLRQCR